MDGRVRRTVATYETNADTYAELHGERDAVANLVEDFLTAVEERRGTADTADGPRVLDVGPGPGWESATFDEHGFDVVALDVTRSFLEQTCERAPDVAVLNGDMRSLPFADDAFDGLWACASLLHVPRDGLPETLAEFERVLASGGAAVVSVQRARRPPDERGDTDVDEFENPYDDDRRHFEQYEPAEIRDAFESVGFDVASVDPDRDWVALAAYAV